MKPRRREFYVEGGGDKNQCLASECRRAFAKLLEAAGVTLRPRVVACGGRRRAYEQFCSALRATAADVWLLVDAEDPAVSGPPFDPWAHVKARPGDGWDRPSGATDDQLHLMTVVMEAWLIADPAALRRVFGPKLEAARLPPTGASLETKDKATVFSALAAATRPTPSGTYGKGVHAFKVLAEVSPKALRPLSWANRFLDAMGATP